MPADPDPCKRRSNIDPTFPGLPCKEGLEGQSQEEQNSNVTQLGTLFIAWMNGGSVAQTRH